MLLQYSFFTNLFSQRLRLTHKNKCLARKPPNKIKNQIELRCVIFLRPLRKLGNFSLKLLKRFTKINDYDKMEGKVYGGL